MIYTTRQIQQALNKHGYKLEEDNVMGPLTEAAITAFKRRNGLRARPTIGPITLGLLFDEGKPRKKPGDDTYPAWLTELALYMGRHETRDNWLLRKWLKSDGRTLGDPSKLPWCGDAIQTAIRLTLPKEQFPGALGKNPWWARNFLLLGKKTKLKLGAIVVASRGSGGHVAAAVGYDPKRKRVRVRGGNQSNMVSDTWLDERRVLGYRAPKTWPHELPPIPIMNSKGQVVSTNEA